MSYGPCQTAGCDRAAYSTAGLCDLHGAAARAARVCDEPGCDRPVFARGLCEAAYFRIRRAGLMPPRARGRSLAAKIPADKLALPDKGSIHSPEAHAKASLTRRASWRTWLQHRAFKDEASREAFAVVERMAQGIVEQRGGRERIQPAEMAAVQNWMVGKVAQMQCLREISEVGAFTTDPEGARTSTAGLRELSRLLAAEKAALQLIGTEARSMPALTLRDIIEGTARQIPAGSPAIEAEPVPSTAEPIHQPSGEQP